MKKVVFVSPVEVDRPVDGLRWRAHLTARGLASLGSITLIEITTDGGRRGDHIAVTPRTPLRRATSRVHPRLPARVAARDWSPARPLLASVEHADLVWVMQPDLVGAGLHVPGGPLVVDMVDLEAGKFHGSGPLVAHQRRMWERLQDRVIAAADAVVLSNPAEAASVEGTPCAVLPNAVDVAPVQAADGPPTLLLVGRFTYQPNHEAARWLIDEVLPGLVRTHPGVRLLLVGRHDGALDEFGDRDGVEILGFVDDLTPVWERASAMVAPIRSGTGTRLKIIESFARGVPVVSTSLGCDGLAVAHDRELLVADDPSRFADQCRRVLDDDDLRRRLRRAGLGYAESAHTPAAFESVVASVGRNCMDGSR
ncbi:MAG: glycosyltransferase [Acidimicrobiales bacterium]